MFVLRNCGRVGVPNILPKTLSRIAGHSRLSTQSIALTYEEYGDPTRVLEARELDLKPPAGNEVVVQMLASPINPADINMVQGVYPVKPPLPAVGGNEGVGEVVETGADVKNMKVGDWVIPSDSGWGTWKTACVAHELELMRIPNDLPVVSAATLAVNPCTAYRMIKDFVRLNPGDTIIQNGGNSAVGQAVIQVAAALGLETINIVRNRPDIESLVETLTSLGASHVFTEEELRKSQTKETLKSLAKPKLAFNCVGGKSATELLRHLAHDATMVTYGGMSKQPVIIPTGALIFKDIRVKGFWMTSWNKNNRDSSERSDMLYELADMAKQGKLNPPACSLVAFEDFKTAISEAMESFTKKQILVMKQSLLN